MRPTVLPDDAAHIAIAAMSGVRFLLTWNFKHIANAEKADEFTTGEEEPPFVGGYKTM